MLEKLSRGISGLLALWSKPGMTGPMSESGTPSCSFCGKSADAVSILIAAQIAAPPAHICEECVAYCVELLKEKGVWPSAPVRLFRALRHRLARGGR
jgi:hypothetical protein